MIEVIDFEYRASKEVKNSKLWCKFVANDTEQEIEFCGLEYMDFLAEKLEGHLDPQSGFISVPQDQDGYWCYSRGEYIERFGTVSTYHFQDAGAEFSDFDIVKEFVQAVYTPSELAIAA